MKAALDTLIAYKFVYFRVFCYFLIPAGTLFLTQTENYSQHTWTDMGTFLHGRLFLACAIAGITSLCAYLDASITNAQEDNNARTHKRATEFIYKTPDSDQPIP